MAHVHACGLWMFVSPRARVRVRADSAMMKDIGANYPSDNHWGNLKKKDTASGKEINYSLHVRAPGIEMTNVEDAVTNMCATMCSVIYESNADDVEDGRSLFYQTIQTQADNEKLQLLPEPDRIFDDHGELKFALAPMATAIIKSEKEVVTMIIAWRGSVRGAL